MRWVVRTLIGVIVLGMIGSLIWLSSAAYVSLRAEKALHATLYTIDLVQKYVDQHEGRWPRSWADLESLPAPGPQFRWPEDSPELQSYVVVDFSVDPRQIAKQTEDEFDAILPAVPSYSFRQRGSVGALIKSLWKYDRNH